MNQEELPIGFAMELAKNPQVLRDLSGMTKEEQNQVINKAREIPSREEMKHYVESLSFR